MLCSSGHFERHSAISVHRLSRRFGPSIATQAIFGLILVSMKFHTSQASSAVFPTPLLAFIAMRGE